MAPPPVLYRVKGTLTSKFSVSRLKEVKILRYMVKEPGYLEISFMRYEIICKYYMWRCWTSNKNKMNIKPKQVNIKQEQLNLKQEQNFVNKFCSCLMFILFWFNVHIKQEQVYFVLVWSSVPPHGIFTYYPISHEGKGLLTWIFHQMS